MHVYMGKCRIMKVRCISDYVTEQQRAALGRRQYQGSLAPGLTIGAEYLVLGLGFEADPDHATTGPYVTILLERVGPKAYDLCLFEVTDPRVSRYWQVRALQFGGRQIVELLPPALFEALSTTDNDERSAEEQDETYFAFLESDAFEHICALLRDEYADTPE